jgi:predicted dienelactone hydrolase
MRAVLLAATLLASVPTMASAGPVGEQHRVIALASAAQRRTDHKPEMEVIIWYPAVAGAKETPDVIGPPDHPYFRVASIAQDAVPARGRHAVILLSHGFGGSAEIMGWLGAAFARAGYVVISVDHPGNSDGDMSLVGAVSWWERPRDMIAALSAIAKDKHFGPLIDAKRVGAAGFSIGGATVLALGGAIISPAHFDAYCAHNRADTVCLPPPEQKTPDMAVVKGIALLGLTDAAAHAREGTTLPGLRAILSISPNSQSLSTASFHDIHVPTVLVAGVADPVVPPARHAAIVAHEVPGAKLILVPGAEHYSFLATCTDLAREEGSACKAAPEQETAHKTAIDAGLALFGRTLGR